jgi:branched-chain amino acid transport system substrate-binding protein
MHRLAHQFIRALAPGVAAAALLIGGTACNGFVTPYFGDLASCNEPGGCAVFRGGDPIRIAVAGPMSGDNSAFGVDEYQAASLAVGDAGALSGHPFEAYPADDLGAGDGGRIIADGLSANPAVVAVMGHAFSGASSTAMPIYEAHFIPMMSGSAARTDLTRQRNMSFNRLISTDPDQSVYAADFLANHLGAKFVAIIHDGTAYGQGQADGVRGTLANSGAQVVAFEAIKPGKMDYSEVLRRIAQVEPDAIYFGGYQPEAAVLRAQMGTIGLDVPFLGDDGVFGNQFLELAGQDSEGVYAIMPGAPLSNARTTFDAAYTQAYGKKLGELTYFSWFYYDATRVLINAVRDVAIVSNGALYVPRKALMNAVRRTQGYQGLTGTVTCGPTGECATAPTFVVYRVQGGQFVQLPPDYKP